MKRTIFYLVTNVRSGRRYVGQTCTTLKERWYEHVKKALCASKRYHYMAITRAVAAHGEDAFRVEHIATAIDESAIGEVEDLLIAQYGSKAPVGYNIAAGGGQAMKGRRHSAVSLAKMSASQKARGLSGAGNPFFGRKHKPETLALFSEQRSGKPRHSAEQRAEMSKRNSGENNPYFGRKHSAETRAKQSRSHKGKTLSAEQKRKIAEGVRRYRAIHG